MTAVFLWLFTVAGAVHVIVALLRIRSGGSESPGPLAGTWQITGPEPETVNFRAGEAESSGVVAKVSYSVLGDDVVVTYKAGTMRGSTCRYLVIDKDVALGEGVTLRRVR